MERFLLGAALEDHPLHIAKLNGRATFDEGSFEDRLEVKFAVKLAFQNSYIVDVHTCLRFRRARRQ